MDERRERPALPVGRGVAQDPLHRDALEPDAPVGVEDRLGVRRVLEQRPEPGLAAAQVGGQLHQPAVLGRERPRGRVERAPQHQQQDRRGQSGHDEHVAPRRLDELDDRGRVLVDLVGPDHRPVRCADRQVDLEVVLGQVAIEHVLLGGRLAEVELAGGLAVEGLREVVVEVEGASTERRQVGEQDGAARRPQLDPGDPARLHEPLEQRIDVAPGGAVRITHRRLRQQGVDAGPDRGLGAARGLDPGGLGHAVGGVIGGDERGPEHQDGGDHEHRGSQPRDEPVAARVPGDAAKGASNRREELQEGDVSVPLWGWDATVGRRSSGWLPVVGPDARAPEVPPLARRGPRSAVADGAQLVGGERRLRVSELEAAERVQGRLLEVERPAPRHLDGVAEGRAAVVGEDDDVALA